MTNHYLNFFPFIVGGFTDGINTCSFTMVTFFISFLLLFSFNREFLQRTGTTFILAVFLATFFLALGHLAEFRSTKIFFWSSRALYLGLGVIFFINGLVLLRQWWNVTRGISPTQKNFFEKFQSYLSQNPPGEIFVGFLAFFLGGFSALFSTFCPSDPSPFILMLTMQTAGKILQLFVALTIYGFFFIVPLIAGLWLITKFFAHENAAFAEKHTALIKIIFSAIFLGTACGLFFTFI